jgi:hypothetical protein
VRVLRRDGRTAAARRRPGDLSWRAYTLDNVVPACASCNASKCNAEVTGWLRRKRLDERGFLLRHLEVRAALALRYPEVTEAQGPAGTVHLTDPPSGG